MCARVTRHSRCAPLNARASWSRPNLHAARMASTSDHLHALRRRRCLKPREPTDGSRWAECRQGRSHDKCLHARARDSKENHVRVERARRPIPRPKSATFSPFACPGPLLRARARAVGVILLAPLLLGQSRWRPVRRVTPRRPPAEGANKKLDTKLHLERGQGREHQHRDRRKAAEHYGGLPSVPWAIGEEL